MKIRGYTLSRRPWKNIEQMFGWMKLPGGLRIVLRVGRWKIQQVACLWAAGYNLLRLAHLEAATLFRGRRQLGVQAKHADAVTVVRNSVSVFF